MSSTPFMQLYVGDYLADTLDLSTEQHGAYLLLLMTMWRHGARLPNDAQKLARIARVSPRRWHLVWAEISRFFVERGGDITSPRLEREYQKAVSISEKRSVAGAKGGAAKALKDNEPHIASAMAGLKHSQIPDTRSKKETPNGVSQKATRLSQEWVLPKAWGEWAVSELSLSPSAVRREADKFRDYWIGKSGRDATKLDWQATWRNWCRTAVERNSPSQKPSTDDAIERWRRISARTGTDG